MTAVDSRHKPTADEALAERGHHARVQVGIEIASILVAHMHRGDVDAVHDLTAQLPREAMRQVIATLAAMVPPKTNPHRALQWLVDGSRG